VRLYPAKPSGLVDELYYLGIDGIINFAVIVALGGFVGALTGRFQSAIAISLPLAFVSALLWGIVRMVYLYLAAGSV
jgi:hypothetical protein